MRDKNPLQGTGHWFNERTGKLTASRMASAMAYLKSGKESSERRKLKIEILAERLTGDIVPKYVTREMEWGIEQEPKAKEAFENRTGLLVTDCGFIDHPNISFCGSSPDGYVSDGCLIEIKCPTTTTMLTWILDDQIPDEHIPQMLLQSACTGKDVWFCAYDPRLPPKQSLLIRKLHPTKEQIAEIELAAQEFLNEVDQMFDQLTKGADDGIR